MRCTVLIGEMAKKKVTKEEIAKLLNIHWNSVANKINGISTFSVEEATEIKNAFFPEWKIEELFKKEE